MPPTRSRQPDGPPPDPEELAIRFLGVRSHSTVELRRKLIRRGCEPDAVDAAIRHMTSRGYLDDRGYAESLVARRSSARGPAAIRVELAAKGIDRATGAEALSGIDAESEREAAQVALARLGGSRPLPADRQERRAALARLAGRLARRGFSASAIRSALGALDVEYVES